MNGGTIRGTALSMDGTARPWMGGYHEWVALDPLPEFGFRARILRLRLRVISRFYGK